MHHSSNVLLQFRIVEEWGFRFFPDVSNDDSTTSFRKNPHLRSSRRFVRAVVLALVFFCSNQIVISVFLSFRNGQQCLLHGRDEKHRDGGW